MLNGRRFGLCQGFNSHGGDFVFGNLSDWIDGRVRESVRIAVGGKMEVGEYNARCRSFRDPGSCHYLSPSRSQTDSHAVAQP